MTRAWSLAVLAGVDASLSGRAFAVQDVCMSCDPQTNFYNECVTCLASSNNCWSYNDAAELYACIPIAGTSQQPTPTPTVSPTVNSVGDVCDRLEWCNDNGLCAETSPTTGLCICNDDYEGETCSQRKSSGNLAISCGDLNNCNNHGRCFSPSAADSLCDCNVGWEGRSCHIPVSDTTVECSDLNWCSGHGRCIQTEQGKDNYCICDNGWKGNNCAVLYQDYVQCGEDLFCGSHGRCIDNNNRNDFCACDQGWEGTTCSVQERCGSFVCQNGAACLDQRCLCKAGFYGDDCAQYDPCRVTRCYNDGQCSVVNGEAFCSCAPGWKGPYCRTRIPCTKECNRGECKHGANLQYCDCPADVEGVNCEEDCFTACNSQTHDCNMVNRQAVCTPKRKSICDAMRPCQNGCTCTDGDFDGYDYTCSNLQGHFFLGKRCNYDEPQLSCTSDHITVTVTNDILLRNIFSSEAKFCTGLDANPLIFTDAGSHSTLRVARKDFSKIAAPVVDAGVLTFESTVKSMRYYESSPDSPVVTTIFKFECNFGVDLTPATITPLEWPRIEVDSDQATFQVEMKFFSVDARAGINRRARTSPILLIQEEIFVNLEPTANTFAQFPAIGSQTGIRVKNCDLVGSSQRTTIIEDGVAISNEHAHASFSTYQPDSGVEFSLIVLNTELRDSTLECTASLCTGDACNHSARVGRAAKDGAGLFNIAIGPFMIADLSTGTQSALSAL